MRTAVRTVSRVVARAAWLGVLREASSARQMSCMHKGKSWGSSKCRCTWGSPKCTCRWRESRECVRNHCLRSCSNLLSQKTVMLRLLE